MFFHFALILLPHHSHCHVYFSLHFFLFPPGFHSIACFVISSPGFRIVPAYSVPHPSPYACTYRFLDVVFLMSLFVILIGHQIFNILLRHLVTNICDYCSMFLLCSVFTLLPSFCCLPFPLLLCLCLHVALYFLFEFYLVYFL